MRVGDPDVVVFVVRLVAEESWGSDAFGHVEYVEDEEKGPNERGRRRGETALSALGVPRRAPLLPCYSPQGVVFSFCASLLLAVFPQSVSLGKYMCICLTCSSKQTMLH